MPLIGTPGTLGRSATKAKGMTVVEEEGREERKRKEEGKRRVRLCGAMGKALDLDSGFLKVLYLESTQCRK